MWSLAVGTALNDKHMLQKAEHTRAHNFIPVLEVQEQYPMISL